MERVRQEPSNLSKMRNQRDERKQLGICPRNTSSIQVEGLINFNDRGNCNLEKEGGGR